MQSMHTVDDVACEFAACPPLPPEIVNAGARAGIPWQKIKARIDRSIEIAGWPAFYAPRADRVVFLDDGRFEFADACDYGDTIGAMIFLALGEGGAELDLVAWAPPRPAALWLGRVGMLGAEELHRVTPFEPLRVFFEVEPWLKNGMHGVVILDDERAAGLLRRVSMLGAANPIERDRLERLLAERTPWVLVRGDAVPP